MSEDHDYYGRTQEIVYTLLYRNIFSIILKKKFFSTKTKLDTFLKKNSSKKVDYFKHYTDLRELYGIYLK